MRFKFFIGFHNNLLAFLSELRFRGNLEYKFVVYTKPKNLDDGEYILARKLLVKTPFGKIFGYNLVDSFNLIEKKDDVVVVKHLFQLPNFFLFLFCKLMGKRLVVYQQQCEVINSKIGIYFFIFLFKIIMPRNAKAFSMTKQGYRELKKYFREVKYLPIPIEKDIFEKREKRNNKKEINLIAVGVLGRKRKNLVYLVKQLEKLKENNKSIKINLTLIGKTSEKYKGGYHNLINRCQDSILDNIKMKENIQYEQMRKEYAKNDVFVLPSYNEPLGFSVLEAMISGLPVIVSDSCGAKSYIDNWRNGFVFNVNRKDDLYNKLKNFFTEEKKVNYELINNMSENNIEKIENEHSPEKFVDEFLELARK